MNDLISRQAAIDLICDHKCGILRRDCPLTYEKDGCEVCNEVALLEVLRAADRWIPVSERVPEDDVSVLVSYIGLTRDKEQYEGVTVASYDSDFDGWYRDNDFAAIAVVTAWQPLPEPYKGGEQ